ncbi:MAG: DUF4430 domain-containing protein [Lachnospiraceae bacterium]|nr:DUF4430 domain-containing protein [Lachnospiraceae bacterium]
MKKINKFFAWLLVFALLLSNMPSNIIARAEETITQVRVIVKNDTYPVANGAKWEGKLIDTMVDIDNSDTAITVVSKALKQKGYTQTGAESNYITEINGLNTYDGGSQSGWMGTLNDWFTNQGLGDYKVSNNTLKAGDTVTFEYSCNWGGDLGSYWSNNDTSLAKLEFDTGKLNKTFTGSDKTYTLYIDGDSDNVTVNAVAYNRNFQVRTYKNTYTPDVAGSELDRNRSVEVSDGDKLYIGVGNKNWPSMNSGQTETIYEIDIKKAETETVKPIIENLNFSAFALTNWVTNESFKPDVYDYDLDIKTYSTSSLSLTSTTTFDDTKFRAEALYADANGNDKSVVINSGKFTSLSNFGFGKTELVIKVTDLTDDTNFTEYKFNVTRPYDTTAAIKSSTGIEVVPEGRSLLSINYQGKPEGTMFKVDADGNITTSGVDSDYTSYVAYLLENPEAFALKLTGKTNYVHIRISEDGKDYTEVDNGGKSPVYKFDDTTEKTLTIQTISDDEYLQNGFTNVEESGKTYTVKIVKADSDTEGSKIISATTESGDWYPVFDKNHNSYSIVIGNEAEMPELKFSVNENSTVKLGNNVLEKAEDGLYHIELKTSAQTINVEAENGISNSYSFKVVKKSKYDVPDKVVDYLCINSQYTNAGSYGSAPENTLGGTLRSLGNFGGYITYYYDKPIENNPNNKYGIDFYVYGNSFASGGSAGEPGQVWVSEDGEKWYALAGSEHYEDSTITDYEITYTKAKNGKTAWTDNQGGSNDGSLYTGAWVSASTYYMNDLAKNDTITLKGILLPCVDGTIYGDSSTASYTGATKFGYVDYFKNGTIGTDVNPYTENAESNGFDLEWAVDEDGNPVGLPNGVHYVKVVTASNIWAGVFGEKSTEVSYVVRTTAAEENVGRTDKPEAIVITDENGVSKEVELKDGVNEYDVTVNDISSVNISVKGVSESDNVYVNNQRITDGTANISVNEDNRKVRVIVQNGDKEPVIYILNIKSDTAIKTENIFNEVTDKFNNGEVPIVDSIGGEWKVIGLSRASQISDTFKEGYFKNVYEYVKAIGSSKLHNAKSTDNSRMILALTSLGYDVTDIAGYNLLEPLGDFDYDVKQGVNGAIWALIALDSNDYKVPSLSDDEMAALKDKLINFILDNQMSSGGFTLNGDEDDVDITAMAVQALAKYYNESEAVEDAVDGALRYFEMVQNSDGSFGNYAATNCESTAQVVIALSVMGINPRTETRFIKNGVSVMSALDSLYLSDGNFCHLKGGDANEMATEQAYLALVAYKRLVENSTSIYDMSDVTKISNPVIKDDDKKDDNKSDDNKSDDNKKDDNKTDNKSDNNGNNSTDTSIKNNDKTSGNDKDSLPKTGDYTNILLYVLLMTASGAGVYVVYRIKRKKDVTA